MKRAAAKNGDTRQVLISKREAARAIGICERTLDSMVRDRIVRCVRIGRRVMFRPESLEEFAQRLEQ